MFHSVKQASLLPEGVHQGATAPHPAQRLACLTTQLAERLGAEIGKCMVLPVPPQIFHRIEFRGVGRQKLQNQPALLLIDEQVNLPAAMTWESIPDDQQLPGQMAQQMAEEIDHLRTSDRARIEPKIKVVPSPPGDGRQHFPVEVILQNRGLAFRSPSANAVWPLAQSGLVDKDDRLAFGLGFFLSWGQRTRFHRRILASSRSNALPTGRWQLQPNFPKSRHTCPGWYSTPRRDRITSATRSTVQRPVPYPNASGPFFRSSWSRSSFSLSSFGLRPARGAAFNPSRPWTDSCLAQRLTDWRCTPTRRATSASETPCVNNQAASSRRRSNALKSRRTPAGFPIVHLLTPQNTTIRRKCHYILRKSISPSGL